MNPDYTKMVNEFCKPLAMEIMFIATCFSVTMLIAYLRKREKVLKKIGKENLEWLEDGDKRNKK